jgi:DNA repair exonuclease SbcCD nuclease subunit
MRVRLALTSTTLAIVTLVASAQAQKVTLPMKEGAARFAVIGDSGTGGSDQMRVAQQLAATHKVYPFEFTVMLGDNIYGGESPTDFANKFEKPYKPLLDAGVKFYAALGNHDDPNQRNYKNFNMNGERYFSFKAPRGSVRFFALDSNYMDKTQLAWLEKELSASGSGWKIAFFHHPLYSSGEKHGSDTVLRDQLEPLFLKYGVDLVLTGHEHFYERIKPQKGINYIILGNSAKLRRGNIAETDIKAKGFDTGFTFMLVEIDGNNLQFQTIDDKGQTIDSGTMTRREATKSRPQPE